MAFSTITPIKLGQAAIPLTNTILYTVPGLTRTFVKDMDICNTTPADLTVRVFLVPSAGAPSTANALMYDIPVPAKSTLQWSGSQILHAGDMIQVFASGNGVTIIASGGEAT